MNFAWRVLLEIKTEIRQKLLRTQRLSARGPHPKKACEFFHNSTKIGFTKRSFLEPYK